MSFVVELNALGINYEGIWHVTTEILAKRSPQRAQNLSHERPNQSQISSIPWIFTLRNVQFFEASND